jgi:hypothetical protein
MNIGKEEEYWKVRKRIVWEEMRNRRILDEI